MSDISQGDGWWIAADGKWYAPELHPDYVAPGAPTPSTPPSDPATPGPPVVGSIVPDYAAETVAIPAQQTPPTANPGPAFIPSGAATETYDSGAATAAAPNDPTYNLASSDSAAASSGGNRKLILGVGALVLVVALGFLAFRFIGGGSSAGGADSPEEAVGQLIASINDLDAVGFAEVFDPDELEGWIGSFTPAIDSFNSLAREGNTTEETSEAYVALFDAFGYTLTGPDGGPITYQVEPLGDSGLISQVRIDGLDFAVSVGEVDSTVVVGTGNDLTGIDLPQADGFELQLRDTSRGLEAEIFIPGEDPESDFAEDAHLDLVTVNKDGKWFVSIGYTMLEIARSQDGLDSNGVPDFGRAFELIDSQTGGADSAEQAVLDLFDSMESLDYDTMIRLTDPLSLPYLHDYQPLIDANVDQQEIRQTALDADFRFDDITLSTSTWDDRTLVTFGNINGSFDGGTFMLDVAAWCGTVEDESTSDSGCLDEAIDEFLQELELEADARDFLPEEAGIVVVERNGRWFVDPLGTTGFFYDQVVQSSTTVIEELQDELQDEQGSDFGELGGFFFTEGAVARQGEAAVDQPEAGVAAVAMDLTGYPLISGDFTDHRVAVARVVTSGTGTFSTSGFDDVPLGGEDWFVVFDDADTNDGQLPAIGALTDAPLDVELFEVEVTEVGPDGFTGQLGGQGRPQVFTFSDDPFDPSDIRIEGARHDSVDSWQSRGVVYPGTTFSSPGYSQFTVISGDPGASFSILIEPFVPDPAPTPDPIPTPEPEPDGFGTSTTFDGPYAGLAARFDETAIDAGYTFGFEQIGGYFDGCGPDDPDVPSYIWDSADFTEVLVLTPYPSPERAQAAFDSLLTITTPCAAFSELEVLEIVEIGPNDIRIEWQFETDPGALTYEHYRLSDSNVIVASSTSLAGVDAQLDILSGW